MPAASASSAPGPGRSPPTRTGTPSWTGSRMSPRISRIAPLSIRLCHGSSWARQKSPPGWARPTNRTHSVRYFHGCYCVGDDQLWGILRRRKGADHTLAALKSIRAAQPGGYRLFVILDNLSANKTPAIRRWAGRANVELCFTPANASWANPIPVIRAGTHVCHARLRLPQPHRAGPQAAGLPALAQCQCPPSRRPGRPASRTGPRSQRTPAPLGPAESQSSTTNTVNVCGQRTS